jgi:AraC-like DNA-binding protein
MGVLGEAINWDLDFRQLGVGKLDARVILLAAEQTMVMRVEFDKKFHQVGCSPEGTFTFGMSDPGADSSRWNGLEATPGALLNFNAGEFDAVNPDAFGGFTLSFADTQLQEVATVLGIQVDLERSVRSVPFWSACAEHDTLRCKLRTLAALASASDYLGLQESAEVFNFELASHVVRILGSEEMEAQAARESAPFRTAALKRALALLNDPENVPTNVSQLCRDAGASLATLERAFTEEFGVTPKSYIQAKRLSSVRRRLLRAGPGIVIADVANRWGFWHMGRFAAEYERKFEELPSQTVRRSIPESRSRYST